MAKPTPTITGPLTALDFVSKHCHDVRRMERNRELEAYLIMRSKVELALQAKGLGSVLETDWSGRVKVNLPPLDLGCPSEHKTPCVCERPKPGCVNSMSPAWTGVGNDGGADASQIEHWTRGRFLPRSLEADGKLVEDERLVLRDLYLEAAQDTVYPERPTPSGHADREENGPEVLTRTMAWQQSCVCQACTEHALPDCVVPLAESGVVDVALLHVYCLARGHAEEVVGMSELADMWGLRDAPFSRRGWYDGRRNWASCTSTLSSSEWIAASDTEGANRFCPVETERGNVSEIIQISSKNRVILPITAWHHGEGSTRYIMNIPPSKPRLYNTSRIIAHRDAPVILTDSVEIALANDLPPDGEDEAPTAIWSTWYGELEAVELIDWSCLKGRTVFCLIAPDPYLPEEEARERAYDTAHAVCEKVSGLRGTKLFFVELPADRGRADDKADPMEGTRVWTAEEFIRAYERSGPARTASRRSRTFAPRSMRELVAADPESRPFLLDPVLPEKSTTLVYAKTNIGKTWFALCVSAAIAHGTGVFGRWRAGRPRRVLYLDCELDRSAMQERVRIVSRMSFDKSRLPPRWSRNLFVLSRDRTSSSQDQFKRDVVRFVGDNNVALVVLDNLAAFTQHNDSARAWEDLHVWIDQLKDVGCGALIIHHESKSGGQRGTSATTNAVDNVFHLVDPDDPAEKLKQRGKKRGEEESREGNAAGRSDALGGLVMKVKVEKGRDIYGVARLPFVVRIDPQAYPPTCDWEELPKDDIDYVEDKSTGEPPEKEARRKREYRDGSERLELWKRLLEKMHEGRRVTDAARDLGVSRSWVDKYLRESGEEAKQAYYEASKAGRRSRENVASRVFREARKGTPARRIAQDEKASESNVRRWIDEGWIAQFRELEGFDLDWDPAKVAKESGASERTASRLMRGMRLQELRRSPEKVAEVVRGTADLPSSIGPDEVQRLCEGFQTAKQTANAESKRREHEMGKIASLYAIGMARNEIIAEIDLPRHTVVAEYNCLVRKDVLPFRNEGLPCGEVAERTKLPLATVRKEYARLTTDVSRLHRQSRSVDQITEYTGLRKEEVEEICRRLAGRDRSDG